MNNEMTHVTTNEDEEKGKKEGKEERRKGKKKERTYVRMDGPTDRPSYRDSRTHLQI